LTPWPALELIAESQRYQRKEEKKLDSIINYDSNYKLAMFIKGVVGAGEK
jgi:hypothetical protein